MKSKIAPIPKSRGGDGRIVSTERATKSSVFTPTQAIEHPNLKLKLSFASKPANTSGAFAQEAAPHSLPTLQDGPYQDKHERTMMLKPPDKTRRSGRSSRKPCNIDDHVTGLELDHATELQPKGKADDGDYCPQGSSREYQGCTHDEDRLIVLTLCIAFQKDKVPGKIHQLQPKCKPSRPSKKALSKQPVGKVDRDRREANIPVAALPPVSQLLHHNKPKQVTVDPMVHEIMSNLQNSSKIYIDLPELANAEDPDEDRPYTAKCLTSLYILCYDRQLWNLCDVIVDTWIRAFHRLRKHSQKDMQQQSDRALWRRNIPLENRKREMNDQALQSKQTSSVLSKKRPKGIGFDLDPPDYKLCALDPELTNDVTDFNNVLLNDLYKHTQVNCGARLLWADAISLCGSKMEEVIGGWNEEGHEIHADLLLDIMQTSLRMVRRKLTLKIEESTEGVWCKRYHEHWKHELPCYRELAWSTANKVDNREDEVASDDADMEALMEAEIERVNKRGIELTGSCEKNRAKRQRIQKEIIDYDAEGDSEED